MAKTEAPTPTAYELTQDYSKIAAGIIKVADALEAIKASGLTERAILILMADATKMPMAQIKRVLDAAPSLALYVKSSR